MRILNGLVFADGHLRPLDLRLEGERIISVAPRGMLAHGPDKVIDAAGCIVSPGFVDIHVHLREPGFAYKETIATGTAAAARGGYTTVCAMPNLSPAPDTVAHIQEELAAIAAGARVRVLPYGCITLGERGEALSQMEGLAPLCCGFSDDGKGVQREDMMEAAMVQAARLGRVIAAHCEVEALVAGGCMHAGERARAMGLPGIVSESESAEVRRDIALCEKTGARLHICHVSATESLAAIQAAKARGLPVTAEVTPHQLLLCQDDIVEDAGRFKMNPPLRRALDRDALVAAAADGVLDAIVTDHAPHTPEEKGKGLSGSAMGVSGLECAFGVLKAGLVDRGLLSMERLLHMLTAGPAGVLGLEAGRLQEGGRADIVILDPTLQWTVRGDEFVSMGKSTPFEGRTAVGKPVCTLLGGAVIYREERF